MSDSNAQPPAAAPEAAAPAVEAPKKDEAPADVNVAGADAGADAKPTEEANKPAEEAKSAPDAAAPEPATTDADKADVEMKEAAPGAAPAPAAAPGADAAPADAAEKKAEEAPPAGADAAKDGEATAADKAKARRKSAGAGESKGKKLNKKGSRARILHLDAKPGDHYFVKLKGYPQWPAIVCDEAMLPQTLIKSRPVSAARQDGTYREDYADGGKRAADRTFPVMYLHTNEFGWVPNGDLHDLDPEKVMDNVNDKMRKDLARAHELASEHHSLDHYKDLLQQFQDELDALQKAQELPPAPAKKSRKSKGPADDEDVEMADADDTGAAKDKKAKKRKAEGDAETPQRSDSVKKPKIKLTSSSTPKGANGTSTPKSGKATDAKTSKPKAKKAEDKKETPKEPELSAEEKHQRKEKEVLFLRHKLQKGLLTRDQEPKEEEMKTMSDYVTKLEGYPDLEVSIIRATKINKVLKAILKLDSIPKEDEFQFKPRSQVLLDKWNKLLAVDGAPAASAPANGVNGSSAAAKEPSPKADNAKETNGVKDEQPLKSEEKNDVAKADTPTATTESKTAESAAAEPAKESATAEAAA